MYDAIATLSCILSKFIEVLTSQNMYLEKGSLKKQLS